MVRGDVVIVSRRRVRVNTDPQRRCYDGAHFSSELIWTEWAVLESMKFLKPGTDPEARLTFWRELNEYAVAARGESARSEYRIERRLSYGSLLHCNQTRMDALPTGPKSCDCVLRRVSHQRGSRK